MKFSNTPPQGNEDPNKNNFFNQNPLLVFAVFSIIAILIFKFFAGDMQQGPGE